MMRNPQGHLLALTLCALLLGSCDNAVVVTPGNPDGGPPAPGVAGLVSITVAPPAVTLTMDSAAPATQAFTATGKFDDGHTEDITSRVTWTTSPSSLGSFTGHGQLQTGPFGGTGQVYARSGTVTGTAMLTVRVSRRIVDKSAPPGTDESKFTGKVDANPPQVVYPYDQVLIPPNLGALEVHWLKGNPANTTFEISAQNAVTDLRIYAGCPVPAAGGCILALDRTTFNLMAYSNNGSSDPLLITVRGTNDSTKTVGTSKTAALRFAAEDIKGGIYYWTAATNTSSSAINRIDLDKGTVEPFYRTADSPRDHKGLQNCVGCHAISHDGTKLAVVLGGGYTSDLVQLDVAKRRPTLLHIDTMPGDNAEQRQFSNFQSYGPDGTSFVSALAGKLRLVSASTGNVLAQIDTGGSATHPDWSRSGGLLAFTRFSDVLPPASPDNSDPTSGQDGEQFIKHGAIAVARWNGNTFSKSQVLVPEAAGQNSYYPSISPNEQYVVFNRVSGCATEDQCSAYDNAGAQIRMIAASGGAEIPLDNINRRGPNDTRDTLTNSWPKWSPFRQTTAQGRILMWVTFSSKRNYGLRLPSNTDQPQLWMAAITVGGEPNGNDPSSAPFWIPAQDVTTHNHIAQWTETIVPIVQ